MGTRTGPHLAPVAAALLLTLTACAQPSNGSAAAPGPLLTRTASAANTARPTTVGSSTAAQPPGTTSAPSATPAPAAPVTSAAGDVVPPLTSCSADHLPTSVRGTLTFAVSNRAGAPWVIGNPARGRGFEAAVGAAVARQLGFAAEKVAWKSADPAQVQAAKVAGVDVGLGEFRTPDQAGGPVDYSTGYFSISDSVVARVGTPAAKATGLTALAKLRAASTQAAAPTGAGRINTPFRLSYPNAAAALAALRKGAADVAVIPTPAAVTAGSDIAVLGQLSLPTEQPAQFGMVLTKSSPLTSCVSAAIDQLRVTGALAALVQRWVPAANRPLK